MASTTDLAAGGGLAATPPLDAPRRRVFILTDIMNEPDDSQSLTRLLLYSNELDLRGLVATTSTHLKTATHVEEIYRILDAYATVRDNLNSHVPEGRKYPPVDSLRAIVRDGIPGYGQEAAETMAMSPGTKLLIEEVDKTPEGQTLYIPVWGGVNVLAQALMHIRAARSEDQRRQFTSKLWVYTISDQDNSGPWIRLNFPEIRYICSIHGWNQYAAAAWVAISGKSMDGGGPDHDFFTKEWREKYIQIGSFGKVSYLTPMYIHEGDTPSFLGLIPNGLNYPDFPEWGGWGGRYIKVCDTSPANHYADAIDTVVGKDGQTYMSNQATIWRWRRHFQNDFKARMQWSLGKDPVAGNHAPVALVNGSSGGLLRVRLPHDADAQVELDASQSWDPDGDELEFSWWQYVEASQYQLRIGARPHLKLVGPDGDVAADGAELRTPRISVGATPELLSLGRKTYHIILEVSDKRPEFPMSTFMRILVDVESND